MNRMKVTGLFVCVMVMILFPNEVGCAMTVNRIEPPCMESASDAQPSGDASPGSAGDASWMQTDAVSDQVLPSDGAAGDGETSANAMTLSPSRCSDSTTHLPAGLFREGYSVWQLCYTTDDPHAADAGATLGRPTSVTFVRTTAVTGESTDLIRYNAPAHASPWTADVAFALPDPPTSYPLFNVRLEYPDGETHLALDRNDDGSALVTLGTMRIWRVYADGHKARYVPRLVANHCTDLVVPDPTLSGSFFPTGSLCPDDLLICSANEYSCFGVY